MSDSSTQLTQLQFEFPETKLCECGCGNPAPIARENSSRNGWIKGQPIRFIHGHNATRSPLEKFWENTIVAGENECWLWRGYTSYGYGRFRANGKEVSAHRFSYELHVGVIPENLCVLHSCDANYPPGDITNRRCVNPKHLWLGDRAENVDDMMKKNRNGYTGSPGETNPIAKLTEKDVREIRERAANGDHKPTLAREYGITNANLHIIVKRKGWKHVT